MTQVAEKKQTPSWMSITDEGVKITLKYPTEINQVKVGDLFMRAPNVKQIRAASAVSNGDPEAREMSLFSSLTEAPEKDLGELKFLDYKRLQEGYFRMVEEDEL